jgi:hypothetical protein
MIEIKNFDRTIAVDAAAQHVRIAPRRIGALMGGALALVVPALLFYIVTYRGYSFTLGGGFLAVGLVGIALWIASMSLSPSNRLAEVRIAEGLVRLGRPFGLGAPEEYPLASVKAKVAKGMMMGQIPTREVQLIVPKAPPVTILALAAEQGALADHLVAAMAPGADATPPLAQAETILAEMGKEGSKTALVVVAAVIGISALFFFVYW